MVSRNALVAALCLALSGTAAAPQPPNRAPDTEVAKGIREVEDGELDAAILTLDAATRRLAGSKERAEELGRAYLYLGIAYFAKGHETLARAKFQQALAQAKDLSLDPEKFSPKVLEAIEQARREASQQPAAPPTKKSNGKLLLLGAGAAAAAGVAVVASGGGSTPTTTTTLPGMPCNQQTMSGTAAIVSNVHQLGKTSGSFVFQWDAQQIPDQFEVFYQGQRLFNTGSVTGAGSTLISYAGTSLAVEVKVTSLGASVLWNYIVGCP